MSDTRSELRFLACGSVDDGKSTLIGRLINDATGLPEDEAASLRDDSRRFGTTDDEFDFALLLDGLEAEREQGITIDVAYRFFTTPRRAFVVGDNVAIRGKRTPWYAGPTLLGHLETVETDLEAVGAPLRFPVQWVNRPDGEFRGFTGTVASGRVAVGDKLVVAGSGRASAVARIVTFGGDLQSATAGRSVTLTLKDEIDIVRGDVLADPDDRPVVTRRFAADLVWMDDSPAAAGHRYLLKIGTTTVPATLSVVADRLEIENL